MSECGGILIGPSGRSDQPGGFGQYFRAGGSSRAPSLERFVGIRRNGWDLHRLTANFLLQILVVLFELLAQLFDLGKSGAQRLPLEWLSLGMLGLIALVYALLKLMHPAVRIQ